jgi:RecA-family ATPase
MIWTTRSRSKAHFAGCRWRGDPHALGGDDMAHDNVALPDLQTIARLLGGEVGGGQVRVPGPGHSATDRSLSIKLDDAAPDGFVVHSFSHDDPIICRDHVRERLGLPAFKPNGNDRARASNDAVERALMDAVSSIDRPKAKVVAQYDYRNADNTVAYQVLKYEPKGFRQRRPNGGGGWIWKLDDHRVVYRLPDLVQHPDATVFVTEGEKDADRVAELGLCSTTVAAGKWTTECIQALVNRDVVILQDNDDAGRKRALEAAQALHGTASTIRIVVLPDLPDKGDVSDWLDAHPHHADKFCGICFGVPPWQPHTKAEAETDTPKAEDCPVLPFIKISDWQDRPVPERSWTVKDRIPAANVTLLSGEGSVGKSILSLQLAVAVALGKDWLGSLPEYGPALVICCEDDEAEVWRRLDLIFSHYGARYTDFGNLHIASLVGGETLMAAPNKFGIMATTDLFKRVCKAASDIQPKLIVLDNAADIYAGSENDRAQVRQFIGHLRAGWAIPSGAGVLLTSHPSLTGISSGSGLSGSTAWNASVRSRLYFKRAITDKDEEPDPDLRVLEVMKSNYGPSGETITLRWDNGLFLPVAGVNTLDKLADEQKADQVFSAQIIQFDRQGQNVSTKRNAPTYAPTEFAKTKEAKNAGLRKADFEAAMRRLLEAGKIKVEPYGPPSRGWTRLVRVDDEEQK